MATEGELAEIKREIVETHNLIIKTDNLVKNLSADIRQIQKKQEAYERKYIFNSVVAYVIFVLIIFAGLYVAFDAKVGAERKERDIVEEKLKKTQSDLDEVRERQALFSRHARMAEQFLRLQKEGRDAEALAAVEGVDAKVLSAAFARLLSDQVAAVKARLCDRAHEEARGLFNKGDGEGALRELDRALSVQPVGAGLAKVQALRGAILLKLNRSGRAADAFLAAFEADPRSPAAEGLLMSAGNALEMSGDVPRAIEVLRRWLAEFPGSPAAAQVRARVIRLETTSAAKRPAVSPPSAAEPPPAPAPAPASPPAAPDAPGSAPPQD